MRRKKFGCLQRTVDLNRVSNRRGGGSISVLKLQSFSNSHFEGARLGERSALKVKRIADFLALPFDVKVAAGHKPARPQNSLILFSVVSPS